MNDGEGQGWEAHVPVLLREVLHYMAPRPGGAYIDATVGPGGHAEAILEASTPAGRLLGIDRDPEALRFAARRLASFGERVRLVQGSFVNLERYAQAEGFSPADGVLFDLGVSSLQLAREGRGFSFKSGGYLDMRFGPEGPTAADLLRQLSERELADVIHRFGEEPRARAIARAIVEARRQSPVDTAEKLAKIVEGVYGGLRGRIHPATRTFQALRIAVNRELEALEEGLNAALRVTRPGGRVVVIAFHSLEDRIVKQKFKLWATGPNPMVRLLTKKPVRPTYEEIRTNPRSRGARLRAVERTN